MPRGWAGQCAGSQAGCGYWAPWQALSCPGEVSQVLGQALCRKKPERQISIFPGCYSHLQKENVQTPRFATKNRYTFWKLTAAWS